MMEGGSTSRTTPVRRPQKTYFHTSRITSMGTPMDTDGLLTCAWHGWAGTHPPPSGKNAWGKFRAGQALQRHVLPYGSQRSVGRSTHSVNHKSVLDLLAGGLL